MFFIFPNHKKGSRRESKVYTLPFNHEPSPLSFLVLTSPMMFGMNETGGVDCHYIVLQSVIITKLHNTSQHIII